MKFLFEASHVFTAVFLALSVAIAVLFYKQAD